MLDDLGIYVISIFDIFTTVSENVQKSQTLMAGEYWLFGKVIPWVDDKLMLHLSFSGGNVRPTFWEKFVYPNVEHYVGAIIFVNMTRPESFREVRAQLKNYRFSDYNSNMFIAPPVIAMYRLDAPNSWSQEDLAIYLRPVLQETEYIEVDPENWDSVKNLLIKSLEHFAKYL